ncbi:MAG TPA: c-type cytochrome [Candidatus Sulfotelmatobacter sp.]|nr:c-type cytochrome [Candidatus Sulfotelmatobacter sp.]
MANNVDSEHQLRPLIGLLTSVLLLGTVLAWWGTRDHRRLFGESLRQPVTAASVVVPELTQEESALVNRGYEISRRQCAGCHEMTTRSNAPSYQEIVTFYRGFASAARDPRLRSRLASAVTHPWPGWGNFAPGPAEPGLSLEDRRAVASWMLNSFDREKNADRAAGQ